MTDLNNYAPIVDRLDRELKSIPAKSFNLMAVTFVLGLVLLCYFTYLVVAMKLTIISLIMTVVIFVYLLLCFKIFNYLKKFFYHHLYQNFRKKYKKKLINSVVKSIDADLKYYPSKELPQNYLSKLVFLPKSEFFKSEDLIGGKAGDLSFIVSDISSMFKNTSGNLETLFKGEVFIFEMKKKFKYPVFIIPDFSRQAFRTIGRLMQKNELFNKSETFRMDHEGFEEHFQVRCQDEKYVRNLLSQEVLEKMYQISKENLNNVYIECVGLKLFLLVYNDDDKLEPTQDKMKILEEISTNIKDIRLVMDMASTLDSQMR
jgi:hypothetical protein